MRVRAIYTDKLLEKKMKSFDFSSPYLEVMDNPDTSGIWLIYGLEKNGKTWFSLQFAEYLSTHEKVLYISAEEGISMAFRNAILRAKIDYKNRNLKFTEFIELEDLKEYLSKRTAPKIIFIDNLTVYNDTLKNGELRKLTQEHKKKLFVFIAHEERGEPYTATAKMAKRLAKIIMRVKGFKVFVSGRCPGGELIIDETKARIYHGLKTSEL